MEERLTLTSLVDLPQTKEPVSAQVVDTDPSKDVAQSTPRAKPSVLKRAFDLGLACFMLVLSTPIWLLITLAILLEDGRPVIYSQTRWGWGGTRIQVYKFRTMIPNADSGRRARQARKNDKRITRVGGFMRERGLDELPQLINILRGEMSFVGPRALAVGEIIEGAGRRYQSYEAVAGFRERLAVRPGLTSLATVYLPRDSHPRRKFLYDLLYIRRRSFWLDSKLIILSIWISIRGYWEKRGKKI